MACAIAADGKSLKTARPSRGQETKLEIQLKTDMRYNPTIPGWAIWLGVIGVMLLLMIMLPILDPEGRKRGHQLQQEEQQAKNQLYDIAYKAEAKMDECKSLGDTRASVLGTCLVWNLKDHSLDDVYSQLDHSMQYSGGNGPITVFLVSGKNIEQTGTYSVSRQAAFRQSVDVYVVQFNNSVDSGTAIAFKEFGADPRDLRQVENNPEIGELNSVGMIAKWIRSLQSHGLIEMDPLAYLSRAVEFKKKHDEVGELRELKKGLIIAPNNTEILNNVAWLLATSPNRSLRDVKKALQYANHAHEVKPGDPDIMKTIAAAYAETNDFEQAQIWAQRALDATNDESEQKEIQREIDGYKQGKANTK